MWHPLLNILQCVLQSFCRKLVWHRECLWPQDLPQHCLLVLEAEDDLVPSKLARTMLDKMNHPCDVRSFPDSSPCASCSARLTYSEHDMHHQGNRNI